MPNQVIGLPQTAKPTREEKSALLASKIYNSHKNGGPNDKMTDRLWDAISKPELLVERLSVSSLGEVVGWAMPDVYPPRNGRTSKALRALGYPVVVHTRGQRLQQETTVGRRRWGMELAWRARVSPDDANV